MKNKLKIKLFVSASLVFTVILVPAIAFAIARDYPTSDKGLQTGMVVSLASDSAGAQKVERASRENSDRAAGIVTSLDDSLVTVSSGTSKVFVEDSGQVEAYVSDIAGPINQGDQLVISPFKGILMKSDSSATKIIGVAAGSPQAASSYDYDGLEGASKTAISKVMVDLSSLGNMSGNVPVAEDSVLVKLGRALTGKEVNEIRVITAIIVFVVVVIAECSIIYGAISGAFLSFGRNPMAKDTIRKELVRVIFIALGVLLIGLSAVYTILRA